MSFKNILGLNLNHADSAACIIKDNSLNFAIEEERLNRKKHWAGIPTQSISSCLNFSNLSPEEIDIVSLNTNPRSNLIKKSAYFLKNYLGGSKKKEIFDRLQKKFKIKNDLIEKFGFKKNIKIDYIDHHLSHIASGFFASDFDKASGISIDGFGDFCSVVISELSRNKPIKIKKKIYFPHSLGVFYEAMTQFAGFRKYGEEYKFMALACMGEPMYFDKILNNLFLDKNEIKLNTKFFLHHDKNYSYKFEGIPNQNQLFSKKMFELFETKDNFQIDKIQKKQLDIASSTQKVFEYFVFKLIDEYIDIDYSKNLILAGGCALNSLSNGKILKKYKDLNLFIPFAPGDSGGAIGSAIISNIKENNSIPKNLKTPYLGLSYSNDYIKKLIDSLDLRKNFKISHYEINNNLIQATTEMLLLDKVGGWFQGRMEFGPRALGNRSIIASPINPEMKDIINKKIKKRENFRPFAPSILIDKKKDWFETSKSNFYMSAVEFIIKEKRVKVPAITHFDGTGRVQDVDKSLNPRFYELIKNFYDKTNIPILLNTSFNENEPIVNNPKEAIECFARTDIDFLVLENFIIEKI